MGLYTKFKGKQHFTICCVFLGKTVAFCPYTCYNFTVKNIRGYPPCLKQHRTFRALLKKTV